jgi:hypothetical protein
MGNFALSENVTGTNNTAIGFNALQVITANSNNTAIGSYSLLNNTTGDGNTSIGSQCLYGNVTGSYNTAVGQQVLEVSSGSSNTAIGFLAASSLTTGHNNIVIGYNAQASSATATGEITLGNGNNIALARLTLGASAWTFTSDRRLKHDIQPISEGLSFVEKLKPVEFVYNNSQDGKKALGFVAQDVQNAMQQVNMDENAYNLVPVINEKDGTLGLSTDQLIPVLTKAIQEQQAEIDALKAEVEALKK